MPEPGWHGVAGCQPTHGPPHGNCQRSYAMSRGNQLYRGTTCTAHSKRTGEPCRNWAIRGSNVCRMHGGGSRQVRAKAQERILGAADLAAQRLIGFMNDKKVPYAIRITAARDLLDRAGLSPRHGRDVTVEAPWLEATAEIVADVPEGWQPQDENPPYDDDSIIDG